MMVKRRVFNDEAFLAANIKVTFHKEKHCKQAQSCNRMKHPASAYLGFCRKHTQQTFIQAFGSLVEII